MDLCWNERKSGDGKTKLKTFGCFGELHVAIMSGTSVFI